MLQISLNVDPDRANLTGITNQDVATIVHTGLLRLLRRRQLRERDRLIPITLRLRCDERTRYEDLTNLTAVSSITNDRVPLNQIARFQTELVAPKICRRDHERCLTVKCDTVPGVLPSQVVRAMDDRLQQAQRVVAARTTATNSAARSTSSRRASRRLTRALVISLAAIYLVLVWQFNSVTKPLVVFAAVPFGLVAGHDGAADLPRAVRLHGLPGRRLAGRRDRQPHHRVVRLHRGRSRERPALAAGGDRFRPWSGCARCWSPCWPRSAG